MIDSNLRLKQTGLIGNYLPVKMVLILGAFVAFITYMREDLYVRFMAHPSLNGLIIATMAISVGMAFYNIIRIRWAARFISKLEAYEDEPSEENAKIIIKKLRKKGKIINTFYMEGAILEMKQAGHLVFTDNQSRIMKSKVGQRTSRMRHNVQYLAGVLVMLGLIGTFWGLLATITSVGEAMATIVNSFDDNGGGGSMVDFLRAISKPLQGMGIAFSASLFGLSGSLITGLLNSFCAKGMDAFLEDFSNWVDARIPVAPAKRTDAGIALQFDPARQLQEFLANFSKQSQTMFIMFSELITALTDFGTQQSQLTRQISAEKRETMKIANNLEAGINMLHHNLSEMNAALSSLPQLTKDIRNDVRGAQQTIIDFQRLAGEQLLETVRQQALMHNNLNAFFEGNRSLSDMNANIAGAIENLHDDTVLQKDKIIEMVLVMQHMLQTQATVPADSGEEQPADGQQDRQINVGQ